MSTPSRVPLDNFDPVSPYAPKWAHDQAPDDEATSTRLPAEPQHPAGIESDHDARILDEIEASLRAMIEANHGGDEEQTRLSDVSRIAAERLAEQPADDVRETDAPSYDEPPAPELQADVSSREARQPGMHAAGQLAADVATVQAAFRDPRTPPWLTSRSLEPEPIPEPWPSRKRSGSNKLFLRFGLAATGAAVVAVVAIKDIPSFFMEKVRGPITDLSTNAAAVFNEGRSTPLQARLDAVQKEQERAPELRFAVANGDPQARAIAVKTEPIGRAAERETVMTPWPSPEAAKRPEPAGWPMQAARNPAPSQAQEPARAPVPAQTPSVAAAPAPAPASAAAAPAPRVLNPEEIAMLRKMGDDYIAAGDFAGARAVLERAADAGDASAAFAIASTYDPIVLVRFKVRGLAPDIVKAGFWYERARELGSAEAPRRLQAMMASRGN